MTRSILVSDEVEALLTTGVRNIWYPIAPSWLIKDEPVGLTCLGERLVVWRDRDGAVQVLEDRCPHRGARLSHGWNLGNRVACWYHGVEVDGDGVVVDVPAVDACPLVGETAVKKYPSREVKRGIFAYFGDALHPVPCDLDLPEQLTSDEYEAFLCTATWRCDYRYAIDNVMDPMHGIYLHAQSHSMARGNKKARMSVRDTEHGFIFEKKDQQDVNFDWVEFGATGAHWLRLEIPYRPSAGPGGNFGIVGFVTPIDEDHCQVFFWRNRKVSDWHRDLWRFMYQNRLEGLHWDVLEQDRIVLEDMPADAREREFLYQHDVGLARLRRQLQEIAEQQVEALSAHREAAE